MPIPWHYHDDAMAVRKVCVGSWENNAYVVACRSTGSAVIIDAAAEGDRVVAAVDDLAPLAVLTTHGHFDHVGAAREVADRLGVPFCLNDADAATFGLTPDGPLSSGPIAVGELTLTAVETPGHSQGSVCFTIGDLLFSGDTLFPGGPGATAGPGADFAQIMASLEDHIFTLADDTLVLPGHGLDTTIGTERPHLPEWRARGW
jgi:glyoxylase-like metal-dependent hydrolase (beta-lactamase superfamily II)